MREIVWIALAAALAALMVIGFLAWTGQASAHESPTGQVYDAWCCNGKDCQTIPTDSVTINDAGEYEITLRPGDHPMVTKVSVHTKAIMETRPSDDGYFHACLWPDENTLRCLYAPPLGS